MKTIKLGTVNDTCFHAIRDEYGNYVPLSELDLEFERADVLICFDSGLHAMPWNEVIAHYCGVASERSRAAAALGSIKSEAKAAAARENGKRGGRPRKNSTK